MKIDLYSTERNIYEIKTIVHTKAELSIPTTKIMTFHNAEI
jgi:hypothetical protein